MTNSLEANVGTLMRRATDVAGVCRDIVMKTAVNISGRKHVRVEGWQAIAVAYGCVLSASDVKREDGGGVSAVGSVRRMSDGVVISTAEGFVGMDEKKWADGPEYARRAMAQTRAMSRAGRSAFSFVVTLIDSSLSTTPAEEMDGVTQGTVEPPAPVARGTQALKAAMRPATPPQSVGAAVTQHANEPPPHTDADFRLDPSPSDAPAHIPTSPPTHKRDTAFAFGRDKGVIVADLSETSLGWYRDCFKRDLADASKANFHAKTRGQLDVVVAELAWRGL